MTILILHIGIKNLPQGPCCSGGNGSEDTAFITAESAGMGGSRRRDRYGGSRTSSRTVFKCLSTLSASRRRDQAKLANRHWLAANMMGEAFLGFIAFSAREMTGKDTIDFLRYHRLIDEGAPMDKEEMREDSVELLRSGDRTTVGVAAAGRSARAGIGQEVDTHERFHR